MREFTLSCVLPWMRDLPFTVETRDTVFLDVPRVARDVAVRRLLAAVRAAREVFTRLIVRFFTCFFDEAIKFDCANTTESCSAPRKPLALGCLCRTTHHGADLFHVNIERDE